MIDKEKELMNTYINVMEGISETSKEMLELIRELVKTTPNDAELGKYIRQIFIKNTDKN